MSVFYDSGGKTIAFNRAGSLFCNYFYFQQLHEASLLQTQNTKDALVYWWVILCHELAHNLVGDHSSGHSYYTYVLSFSLSSCLIVILTSTSEGFVAQYFPKIAAKIAMSTNIQS